MNRKKPRLTPFHLFSIRIVIDCLLFYDREILGLWVSGDGLVYRDFDKSKMVIPRSSVPDDLHIYCGVDWGFEHKGVITVWGDDTKGNIYMLEEHTSKYK